MNDKISIVVPIYNTSIYLNKCIDSILKQTYKNIEIILINDGSTDESEKICKEYKDDRIKYIYKENTGVSDTRNLGIEMATGKYILFIDSDDYIEKNMIEVLYNNMINNNSLLSICTFKDVKEKNLFIYNKEEILYSIFSLDEISGYIWNKLLDLDIIKENNMQFNNKIFICEDLLFIVEYISYIDKAVYSSQKLYNYVVRENSALNSKITNKWLTLIDAYDKIEKYYKKSINKNYEIFLYNKLILNLYAKTRIKLNKFNNKKYLNKIEKNLEIYKYYNFKTLSIKQRLKLFVYYDCFDLIYIIKKIFRKR